MNIHDSWTDRYTAKTTCDAIRGVLVRQLVLESVFHENACDNERSEVKKS